MIFILLLFSTRNLSYVACGYIKKNINSALICSFSSRSNVNELRKSYMIIIDKCTITSCEVRLIDR